MVDVAIIGGGPSGAACAIALGQTFPWLRVVVIEASDYTQPRAGEVLPPAARGLLQHLGVLSRMSPALSSVGYSIASAWGSASLEASDYFSNLSGEAWHLERDRFDALLADRAEELGAVVLRDTAFQSASREESQWRLQLSAGSPIEASFIVDATGRSAAFARTRGIRVTQQDSLIAFSRFFRLQAVAESRTLIESSSSGWWYTAPLPHSRRVVTFFTDSDIARELGVAQPAAWLDLLAETRHIQPLLETAVLEQTQLTRSAASSMLDEVYGDGWLATGDSAASSDPLSAQGITSALRSGILAAYAVGDVLTHHNPQSLVRYASILRTQRASYERTHAFHYAREQRWRDHPFWSRRQTAASANATLELQEAR
jgi:flavin-dependent dehydrogenase